MSRRDTDRNLLFGILALQMDFVTRDALVAAMNAWVMEKHRALGEILVGRGDLDPADRVLLDPMVDRHVAKHGGDPIASLAALSSAGDVASDLRREVDDPDVQASLAFVPPSWANDDPHATSANAPPEASPNASRYQKGREFARGNLGVVFVARDIELNREVALKEIKDQHADHPHHRSRFLLEAEVTGSLEHPGIVPVYGLGHHEDGRPFYIMRFIRGASLMEAINRFHSDPTLGSDPGRRKLAIQKLLRRFTDVCNAVDYAHSRGILHRDLKPQNVMVGKYGETLVVDWGLAKAVGKSGEVDVDSLPEATLHPASAGGLDATLPGSLVGTPAYMSPEQAAGRLDLLGPASDVYGLGATLYHLLAGRSPIADNDLVDALRKAQAGDFPQPRAASPWLDPALNAICLKAMALRPDARYPSPRTLAEDVERWVAGEPVAAYPEPFARKARRWAGKHRTAVTTACTSALMAAILLGGVARGVDAQRRRADAAALATLSSVEQLEIEARATSELAKWTEAIAEARRAEAQLESGGTEALRSRTRAKLTALQAAERLRRDALRDQQRDSRMVDDLDEARLRKAEVGKAARSDFDLESTHEAFLQAFRWYGIDVASLMTEEAAARVRSSRIAEHLVAALDEWGAYRTTNVKRERLVAIATAAGTDPELDAMRHAISRRDSKALLRFVEGDDARRRHSARLHLIFDSLKQFDPTASLQLLEVIRMEHPGDFWFNQGLASAYMRASPPRFDEAARYYTAATAIRPKSPGAHRALGVALREKGDYAAAVASCRVAIRLSPGYSQSHDSLGAALRDKGDFVGAAVAYREAIRLRPENPDYHNGLGLVLAGGKDLDGAIIAYREAIRHQPDHPFARGNLVGALREKGKLDDAIVEYHELIRLRPEDSGARLHLGDALEAQGKFDEAVAAFHEAVRLRPDDANTLTRLARARRNAELEAKLTAILKGQVKPAGALERLELMTFCYKKGLHATATRFGEEAFAERPELVDNPENVRRYDAACAAALAGSGLAKEDPPPDAAARAGFRGKARDWLQADLAAWARVLDGGNEPTRVKVARSLAYWKVDADLTGIRDEAALAKLPEVEREELRSLWGDVETLRKKAEGAAGGGVR